MSLKILRIRLKNVNSLHGGWEVDFRDPAYMSSALFLVHGPTGVGKTSIFDALSLGLFGMTSRCGAVTASSNEVMHRGEGECAASVLFRTEKGEFESFFYQKAAAKSGKLQPPQQEILDGNGRILHSGREACKVAIKEMLGMDHAQFFRRVLLAQGQFAAFLLANEKDRASILEKITSTPVYGEISTLAYKEKAEAEAALEKLEASAGLADLLTGDEEKMLSRKVESLSTAIDCVEEGNAFLVKVISSREDALKKARALRTGRVDRDGARAAAARAILVCGPARTAMSQKDILNALAAQAAAREGLKQAALTSRENWKKEEIAAETAKKNLDALTAAKEKHDALAKALAEMKEKASTADRILASGNRQKMEAHEVFVRTQQAALDALCADLAKTLAQCEELDKSIALARKDFEFLGDANIEKSLNLLRQWADAFTEGMDIIRRGASELKGKSALRAERRKEKALYEESLRNALAVFMEEGLTKEMSGNMSGEMSDEMSEKAGQTLKGFVEKAAGRAQKLGEILDGLLARQKTFDVYNDSVQEFSNLFAKRGNFLAACKRAALDAGTAEKELEDFRKARDAAAHEHLLQTLRKDLHDGQPCPLCGSLEHASQELSFSAPVSMNADGIEKNFRVKRDIFVEARSAWKAHYRMMREILPRLRALRCAAPSSLAFEVCRAEAAEAGARVEILERSLSVWKDSASRLFFVEDSLKKMALEEKNLRGRILESCRNISKVKKILLEEYVPFPASAHVSERPGLVSGLEKTFMGMQRDMAERDRELARVRAGTEEKNQRTAALSLEKKAFLEIAALVAKEEAEIIALLGVGGREPFMRALEAAEKDESVQAREAEASARESEAAGKALSVCTSQCLADAINREHALRRARETTALLFEVSGGRGLKELRKTLEGLPSLEDAVKILTEAENAEKALAVTLEVYRRAEDEFRVACAGYRMLMGASGLAGIGELAQWHEEIQEVMSWMPVEIRVCADKIAASVSLRAKKEQDVANLAVMRDDLMRKAEMDKLIGSAGGDKFRVFAQGLTLERVLGAANGILCRMMPRYRLVRDEEEPLGIMIDDDQCVEGLRNASNLSGGESFVVSLALALGLSSLSGAGIESLFLDEGFGTLNDEALHLVLEALRGLEDDGSVSVGIISHVPALYEAVETRISVYARGQARSGIEGPGCRALDTQDWLPSGAVKKAPSGKKTNRKDG